MNTIGGNGNDIRGESESLGDDAAVDPLDHSGASPYTSDEETNSAASLPIGNNDAAVDDAVEIIGDGPEPESADEVFVAAEDEEGSTDAPDAASSSQLDEQEAAEDADANVSAARSGRFRELARLKVDASFVKRLYAFSSLGRTALLCVGIFAITVSSAYFFVLQPVDRNMHEVREQKNLLHDYVVIQQAGATIGSFKDGLMTGDQRLTVMSEVRLMADGSSVKIVGDPELLPRRSLTGHFADYPVRLRLRGTYHEIGEFLSLLESSPRFIAVESVEITSDVGSSSRESDATVLLAMAAWEG